MKINEYKPVGNTFLCKPVALTKNELVPESMQERLGFEIIALGTAWECCEDINVGDVVLVSGDSHSDKIMIDGTDYWIFSPDMLIAKIEM